MDKKDIKSIIRTALSLFLICAVATGILAFINSVTAPIITQNNAAAADAARLEVLPEAEAFTEADSDGTDYYIGKSGSDTVGYEGETGLLSADG